MKLLEEKVANCSTADFIFWDRLSNVRCFGNVRKEDVSIIVQKKIKRKKKASACLEPVDG